MAMNGGKKLENPIRNPVENPNLMPEQEVGREPGGIEFKNTDLSRNQNNPDKSPTQTKEPMKFPGKKRAEKEILKKKSA